MPWAEHALARMLTQRKEESHATRGASAIEAREAQTAGGLSRRVDPAAVPGVPPAHGPALPAVRACRLPQVYLGRAELPGVSGRGRVLQQLRGKRDGTGGPRLRRNTQVPRPPDPDHLRRRLLASMPTTTPVCLVCQGTPSYVGTGVVDGTSYGYCLCQQCAQRDYVPAAVAKNPCLAPSAAAQLKGRTHASAVSSLGRRG